MRVHQELEDVITVINTTNNDAEDEEAHQEHKDEKHNHGHHVSVVFLRLFLPYFAIKHLAPMPRELCMQLASFITRKGETLGHCALTTLPRQCEAGVVAMKTILRPHPPFEPLTMANFEHFTMVGETDATSRSLIHVLPLQMQIQVMFAFEYFVADATSPVLGTTPFALFLLFMVVVQVSVRIKRTSFRPVLNTSPRSNA